jgi:hypothetical protein
MSPVELLSRFRSREAAMKGHAKEGLILQESNDRVIVAREQ